MSGDKLVLYLKVPPELHERVGSAATRNGFSINMFCVILLTWALDALETGGVTLAIRPPVKPRLDQPAQIAS